MAKICGIDFSLIRGKVYYVYDQQAEEVENLIATKHGVEFIVDKYSCEEKTVQQLLSRYVVKSGGFMCKNKFFLFFLS